LTTIFSKKDKEDIRKKVDKALEITERRGKFMEFFQDYGLILLVICMVGITMVMWHK
tara:strand:+ start:2725 stop:2895 length:171 start_codon:yes stop_codon:yes gene_type:complete